MMFIVAADHTARGMVGLGDDPLAMADRRAMLDGLLTALEHPRVDGVLASADIMEDLVAPRSARRPGRGRHDEPGRVERCPLGARRPVHRLRHAAPDRRATSTPASCCCASTTTIRAPCRRSTPCARAVQAAQRSPHDRNGRADPVHQGWARPGGVGPRRAQARAGRRHQRRPRWIERLHMAEDPGDGGHRHGGGDDDPARCCSSAARRGRTRRLTFATWERAIARADRARARGRPGLALSAGRRRGGGGRAGRRASCSGGPGSRRLVTDLRLAPPAGSLATAMTLVALTAERRRLDVLRAAGGRARGGEHARSVGDGVERAVVLPRRYGTSTVEVDGAAIRARRSRRRVQPGDRLGVPAARTATVRSPRRAAARWPSPRAALRAALRGCATAPPGTSRSRCAAPARRRAR